MDISTLPEHHAILVTHSDRKKLSDTLWEQLRLDSLAHVIEDKTIIDIDTARALTSWVNTPYNGKKIALLSFHTITIPAQNALLKILEEPREGVQFILVTSNKEALIPTLISRLYHTEIGKTESKNSDAELFLVTPSDERMKLPYITNLLNSLDEEGRKNREGVRIFILTLIETLKKKGEDVRYIEESLKMASYASDISSSGKAILEYLSLLLPQRKA